MVQSILSNMAVILLSHLLVTSMLNYRERFKKITLRINIIIILSATIITMFYLPIYFGDYRFDLRLIPLIMLAFYSGWRITIPVLIIAAIWRFFLGGDGAFPGIVFGMTIPTLFALLYVEFISKKSSIWNILIVAILSWCISDFPIIFYTSDAVSALKPLFSWRFVSFLIAALVYYVVIEIDNKRMAMKEELHFLATHDQLTKLLNKQECVRRAEIELKSKVQQEHFFAMIDLDYFKKLNDEFGHFAGDEALIQIATIFRSFENDQLLIARYGGEEFLLYTSAKNCNEALNKIEELQEKIRGTKFQVQPNLAVPITVSIGLAKWNEGDAIEDVIKEADRNLYIAKERGRDQLIFDAK